MSVARISLGGLASESVDELVENEALRLLELQRKIENLERAVATQRMIGTAVGLLAQRYACTTDQAWAQLRHLSQVTNIKVREVARILRDAFDEVPCDGDAESLAVLRQWLPDSFRDADRSCVHERSTGDGR